MFAVPSLSTSWCICCRKRKKKQIETISMKFILFFSAFSFDLIESAYTMWITLWSENVKLLCCCIHMNLWTNPHSLYLSYSERYICTSRAYCQIMWLTISFFFVCSLYSQTLSFQFFIILFFLFSIIWPQKHHTFDRNYDQNISP